MLTVPDFFKGVESDNPSYDFTHHFGKMMVLYRTLGGRPGISISTSSQDGFYADVKAKTKRDATYVNETMNNTNFTVYGNKYGIMTVQEQKVVHIQISKL